MEGLRLDPWLARQLVCPRDAHDLTIEFDTMQCRLGHNYPVVGGIPILLIPEANVTHQAATVSINQACRASPSETSQSREAWPTGAIDSFVQLAIGSTNGQMWWPLVGRLREYPVPNLSLEPPSKHEEWFLDLGCNWGRWCLAAGRLGYRAVGIDVSLDAVRAAYRVAHELSVKAQYLVADARYIPFRDATFSVVSSYSVLQHFEKADATRALSEARRVLVEGGIAHVQMANRYGVRSLYHQAARGFRQPTDFEVRYWGPRELVATAERLIGPAALRPDGYFSLNAQAAEAHLLPRRFRAVARASGFLQALSAYVPALTSAADSVWGVAHKR